MNKVIVYSGGGIGNQLFQYAMGLVLGQKNQAKCWVDSGGSHPELFRPFLLDRLKQPAPVANLWETKIFLGDRTPGHRLLARELRKLGLRYGSVRFGRVRFVWECKRGYNIDQSFPAKGIVCLVGVWQSHLYWQGYEEIIRRCIALPQVPLNVIALAADIQNSESVAVHVRRTDYLHQSQKYVNCSMDYYLSAIRQICERVQQPVFYVFSDDIKWCRMNMSFIPNVNFVETPAADQPICDLTLMSMCRHHIISNSTFSWWGAWLGALGGVTICPKRWYSKEEKVVGLYPTYWQAIDF